MGPQIGDGTRCDSGVPKQLWGTVRYKCEWSGEGGSYGQKDGLGCWLVASWERPAPHPPPS